MKLKTNLLICASLISFYGYSSVAFSEQEAAIEPMDKAFIMKTFGVTDAQASMLVQHLTDEAKKMKADFPGKSLTELKCTNERNYAKATCASRNYVGNQDLVGSKRSGTKTFYGMAFTLSKLRDYDGSKTEDSAPQIQIEQSRWNNTSTVDQKYGNTVVKLD